MPLESCFLKGGIRPSKLSFPGMVDGTTGHPRKRTENLVHLKKGFLDGKEQQHLYTNHQLLGFHLGFRGAYLEVIIVSFPNPRRWLETKVSAFWNNSYAIILIKERRNFQPMFDYWRILGVEKVQLNSWESCDKNTSSGPKNEQNNWFRAQTGPKNFGQNHPHKHVQKFPKTVRQKQIPTFSVEYLESLVQKGCKGCFEFVVCLGFLPLSLQKA